MRKDIIDFLIMKNREFKDNINISELARKFNCSRNTVRKYLKNENLVKKTKRRNKKKSMLDPFKAYIVEKINEGINAKNIHRNISTKKFNGTYSIVRDFVRDYKQKNYTRAIISKYNHIPGHAFQMDWKEKQKITLINGKVIKYHVFALVSVYSKFRFFKLVFDTKRDTLKKCTIEAFEFFGGVPKKIIYDNMATMVDRDKMGQKDRINSEMIEFAKDFNFEIKTCAPYKPNQKATVETSMKFLDYLKSKNNELASIEELNKEVEYIQELANNQKVDSIETTPLIKWKEEKNQMSDLPNKKIIENYKKKILNRKVPSDCFVSYLSKKYLLSSKFIGKEVQIKEEDTKIIFFFKGDKVEEYKKSGKKMNIKKDNIKDILKSNSYPDYDELTFEKLVEEYYENINF